MMLLFLFSCVAMCSWSACVAQKVLPTTDVDDHGYVFEIMAITILALLVSNCWLWRSRASHKQYIQKTSASFRLAPRSGSQKEQCSANESVNQTWTSDFEIHFAQNSVRWHRNKRCAHLKGATTKICSLSACQTCAANFRG